MYTISGRSRVPKSVRLWCRVTRLRSSGLLAELFAGNPQVIFGLMRNEPAGVPAPALRQAIDDALAAIRQAGAKNLVLIPGVGWSAAHNFVRFSGNVLAGIDDPDNNFAYEVHQYFDFDQSGTHADCAAPNPAVAMLIGVTQWLRSHHARGFLGEFAVGRSEECLATLRAVLSLSKAKRRCMARLDVLGCWPLVG